MVSVNVGEKDVYCGEIEELSRKYLLNRIEGRTIFHFNEMLKYVKLFSLYFDNIILSFLLLLGKLIIVFIEPHLKYSQLLKQLRVIHPSRRVEDIKNIL
jgi:hypothetical protein